MVVTRYDADANILTTLTKIVSKAGLVPWAELMLNLRATRETELLVHYPTKDVTSWPGNSPEVANTHYAMTMQASFDRAIEEGAKIVGVTTVPNPFLRQGAREVTATTQRLAKPSTLQCTDSIKFPAA